MSTAEAPSNHRTMGCSRGVMVTWCDGLQCPWLQPRNGRTGPFLKTITPPAGAPFLPRTRNAAARLLLRGATASSVEKSCDRAMHDPKATLWLPASRLEFFAAAPAPRRCRAYRWASRPLRRTTRTAGPAQRGRADGTKTLLTEV